MENWIDLENLIKNKNNKIDWSKNINKCVNFYFEGVSGTFKIIDKIKNSDHVIVEYLNKEYDFLSYNLLNCKLGKFLNYRNFSFLFEIGDTFKSKSHEFKIIDRYYTKNTRYYKYECLKCGNVIDKMASRVEKNTEEIGCGICSNNIKSTTEEFITKANKVHNFLYDYSLVDYKRGKDKVKIICKIHGVFEQIPNSHLIGQGCPKCNGTNVDTELFIEKAIKKFGGKYDYSLVDYKNQITPVKIICSVHGVVEVLPINFLDTRGCNICYPKASSTTEEFIEKSKKIHGDTYDYSLVEYKNRNIPIKLICKFHGEFEQSPSNHLRGSGCKICNAVGGYNLTLTERNKHRWIKDFTNIYLFKLKYENEEFYKIGIAKNIKNRLNDIKPYDCELIYNFKIDRYNASYIEKLLHTHFYKNSYVPNVKFEGYTECFDYINLEELKGVIDSYDIKVDDSHES